MLAIAYGADSWQGPAELFWVFAGPQYIVFSSLTFLLIGMVKSERNLWLLSYCAPIIFLFFWVPGLVIEFGPPSTTDDFVALGGWSSVVLMVGYVVAFSVDIIRVLLQWAGIVKPLRS